MREIPGPNPHEFGIVSKNRRHTGVGVGARLQTENEFLMELEAQHKQEAKEKIKTEFFRDIDRKAKEKTLRARVENAMEARNLSLYERRKRLRDLLVDEQRSLEEELIRTTLSTQLERASVLREKANEIRRKREMEQAAFVQEKLNQKWISENDELRNFASKQMQAGTREAHMKQIGEKIEREQKKLEEEAMFAELWYADAQAKKDREDREKVELAERNVRVSEALREKMRALDQQRLDEKRMRNENAKLMKQKHHDDELEKLKEYQDKLESQANRRREIDLCLKAKKMNEERLAKEELSFDLKMLEDALQSYQNEDQEKFERKKELFREQKLYRDYLANLREEERQREKELNEVVNKEIEKQFEKRLTQWRKDKENRKQLLDEVIHERGLQIREKIIRSKEDEELANQEKAYMDNLARMYNEDEKAQRMRMRNRVNQYRDDLIQQMSYLDGEKQKERNQDWIDYQTSLQEEMNYQNRVVETKKQILYENARPL